ncbi:MAG: hypothetical protein HFG49_13305 [Lachnospiraceae bacterium]|jgi:hypothetical protein|nr:hypothetical protein [Lachnospiraceae bacterium]
MMAFGIGTNSQKPTGNSIRGIQKKIACECWFTSTGKITPLMLKVEDEDGLIQTIRQIKVHSQETKLYAGIPSVEYDCTLFMENRKIRGWLIYYQTENRWILNFR